MRIREAPALKCRGMTVWKVSNFDNKGKGLVDRWALQATDLLQEEQAERGDKWEKIKKEHIRKSFS